MKNKRIKICVNAEVHFPSSDKIVLDGITGNISQNGIKINNLKHNPSLRSEANEDILVKLFFEDGNQFIPVTLQGELRRGHKRGLGIQFKSMPSKEWRKLERLIRKTLRDSLIKNNNNGWHFSKAA